MGSALISTCTSSLGVCLSGDVILANALTPTRPTTGSVVSLRSLCSFDIASFIDVTFSELVGVKMLESEVDDSSVMSIVVALVVVLVIVTPVACAVVDRLRTELIVGSPLLLQSVTVTRLLDLGVSRAKTAKVVLSSKCNRSLTDFGDCTSGTGLGDICATTVDLFASPSLSFSFAEGLLSLDLSFAFPSDFFSALSDDRVELVLLVDLLLRELLRFSALDLFPLVVLSLGVLSPFSAFALGVLSTFSGFVFSGLVADEVLSTLLADFGLWGVVFSCSLSLLGVIILAVGSLEELVLVE